MGSEPEILFYSGRHSATGGIYTYALMERQQCASLMQRQMIAEIEQARPQFLLTVKVPTSWLTAPDSDKSIFAWAEQYAQHEYDLVGIMDVLQASKYVWGDAAKPYRPRSRNVVYIFQRKPA